MGQQQLLLLILGTVVVSLAVVVAIGMFQDHAVEHDRAAVMVDLKVLGAKAQSYYNRPMTMGGGSHSFVGLTADARGIGMLAGPKYIDNANGTYTIKSDGTVTQVVLHGIGKVAMSDGSYPAYDLTVTAQTQTLTKVN
ncbi:MAG TPA: hypothetical protein VMH23_06785 [Bacteroidota bacterium]|nr:hypothetical protein [Bacteroidota bacterium]